MRQLIIRNFFPAMTINPWTMGMNRLRQIRAVVWTILAVLLLAGCAADWAPVYFPPQGEEPEGPQPGGSPADLSCTISFTSQLCVVIKGENIDAGMDPEEPLCVEASPFPIHISGSEASIIGSEFPDIKVEGHGLPAPITINAKGSGTGDTNIGKGNVDAAGNITIENFSFYIDALGMIGEVPGLTLTTGTTEELPDLAAISGSPPDASGAMTLVTGTTLGHLFDAADELLLGASLQATFSGSISPTLDSCSGSTGPVSIEINKLYVNSDGEQNEEDLPDGNRMEVSSGTFIAQGASDIGPRFEATAKFRIKNISSKTVTVNIASSVGAFFISSMDALSKNLEPQQMMVVDVTFRPTIATTPEEGEVIEPVIIGTDAFKLVGVARSKSGDATISVVNDEGELESPDVDDVDVGGLAMPANSQKEYFQCDTIKCGETDSFTNCSRCSDRTDPGCRLIPVSTTGQAIGAVDASCEPVEEDATPRMTIDLRGASMIGAGKKIAALRNMGVVDLSVTAIKLEEAPDSRSTGQFALESGAIFVADSFDDIKDTVAASFPFTLPPYQSGYKERSAYIVVTYHPTDLVGADGTQAGVGSTTKDRAILRITTDRGEFTADITGETTILEVPMLELYFKTSTGVKKVENGRTFPFRDVTAETVDSANPLFLKLSDTASSSMRVVSIKIEGGDSKFFEWLDTAEKIRSRSPASGSGKRCSIPVVDPATGQMTNEIFDLDPVPLGARGFDLAPGAYSTETMPLFGCVNFHRDTESLSGDDLKKRLFSADIKIIAQQLDLSGNPVKNPDGSYRQTELKGTLLAAINPISGKVVLRITQTVAAILHPQFPGLSATTTNKEKEIIGEAVDTDYQILIGAFMLDPFDEETITDVTGKKVLTTPNDGITGVFRALDTHPVSTDYEDPFLFDHASLIHDAMLPEGSRGVFEGFPNVPDGLKTNGWRIFTSSLSYPGPLAPPEQRFEEPSGCIVINPCDPDDLRKFTPAGVPPGEKGACAFFYSSGGRYDSPAYHTADEMTGGEYQNLCNVMDKPQNLYDVNTGHYTLDGEMTFEDIGFRFFGPTYFHNPGGPLGPVPPMDVIFHVAFTNWMLKPPAAPGDVNTLPDTKINLTRQGYKMNLNDPTHVNPPICEKNTNNRIIGGKRYSTWKYLAPLLSKDESGTIPAGCPEPGNSFTGGTAFLHGRKLNHETGIISWVAGANFGSSNDLTFAFKDIMMFVALHGWICNPQGSEADFEGARCYDLKLNERDTRSQVTIMDE